VIDEETKNTLDFKIIRSSIEDGLKWGFKVAEYIFESEPAAVRHRDIKVRRREADGVRL
jgi:hypothetical protein